MARQKGIELSRRSVLGAGFALTAAGVTALPRLAAAKASLEIGDHTIMVLSDGHLSLPMNFALPEQGGEEIEALLKPHGLSTDVLTPDCNVTLMTSGDRVVLFDAGSGPNFQPTAGSLPSHLEEAGFAPDDITDVIFTHAHPDHLWGILDEFDDPLYPQARLWVPQAEWDYWRADDTLANMPEERKSFVVGAQARFEAIEDQVAMITPGQEVVPGVEAVDTAGHTPGHMSYMIHGGSESILVIGDAITNAVISFEKPEWASGSDQDRDLGINTRKALLDRLALDRSRVIGFHFPHPGGGFVERAGSAYRFVVD
jgi:glyoxylase-like metal-dependent hydrolase (beta-lactamase superfamily II)